MTYDSSDDYDHRQIYENKLSKLDTVMIALSPDGQDIAVFEPHSMRLMTSPSDKFVNLDVKDLISEGEGKRSIDKHQLDEAIEVESDNSTNDFKINIVEISDSNKRGDSSDKNRLEVNFQKSFYNLRDYLNEEEDIAKRIEFVSSLKGWSIAISDRFYCSTLGGYNNLIALSRIEKADVENVVEKIRGYVIVFSAAYLNSLFDPIGESIMLGFGGLVDFFKVNEDQILCIKNRDGIHKYLVTSCTKKLSVTELERLKYPKRMERFNKEKPFFNYIRKMNANNYFLVDSIKSSQYEPLELYDLKTNQLISAFNKPKEKAKSSNSTFSISNNRKLLAYLLSDNEILIYSVENSILICRKSFETNAVIQVLHFFDNDERLFIFGEGISCIWNLFSTNNELINIEEMEFKNELEQYKYFKTLSFIAKSNSSEGIIAVADKITKRPAIRKLMSYVSKVQKDSEKLTNVIENFTQIDDTYSTFGLKRNPGRILSRSKSYILQKDPRVVLSIGSNVVQVWRTNADKKWILEYIWTSEETLFVKSLDIGSCKFSLVLTNQDPGNEKGTEYNNVKEIKIKIPDQKGMVTVVKHACQSLEYLDKQKDVYSYDDNVMELYNDIVNQTTNIIYKFIKDNPYHWMFMDIRYNVMANLIRARALNLIFLILFNDDEKLNIDDKNLSDLANFNVQNLVLHRPQISRWSKPENDEIYIEDNDLEVALQCYEVTNVINDTNHDIIIFACFWEYYLRHATDNVGWTITMTKILPRLVELQLDSYYIEGLLYKPCFELNKSSLPFVNYRKLSNNDDVCVAIPLTELSSESTSSSYVQLSKNELYQINILPVVNFTVSTSHHDLSLFKKIMYTFLPRNYLNRKVKNNSPLISLLAKKDFKTSFFENPIMEVTLEWMWRFARQHYLVVFILYILHLISFSIISFVYTSHRELTGIYRLCFFITTILSYYTSLYFTITELKQMNHYGFRHYIKDFFNWFDLSSGVLPLISISFILKDVFIFPEAFKDIVSKRDVVVSFSFIILLLWIELILLLRLFMLPSRYIYILLNIVKQTWPILLFNLVVNIGFAHSLFILLGYPSYINLNEVSHQFNFNNITITEESPDNPFSNPFSLAISSAYWDDLPFDQFNFWPVKVISSLGSLVLVFMIQNIVIALMNGVYAEAEADAKLGVLKFRSQLIFDFESLEKSPWLSAPKQPHYFAFIDRSGSFDKWKKISDKRKVNKIFSLLAEFITIPDSIDDSNPVWTWNDEDV